jgi:DNA polymerase I-like protein with 3'-5' exonuclease and polymerase domains
MKIAVVEKVATNKGNYSGVFNFDYDLYGLTNTNKKRMLKADISLDIPKILQEYDYIITVGAEPSKFICKVTNVTKYSGELVDSKFLPIINPYLVKFRPEMEEHLAKSIEKIHKHISGTYSSTLGSYMGIDTTKKALQELNKAPRNKIIAVDCETTCLYPRDGYVLGISLSWEEGSGIYIDANCINDEVEKKLQQIFNTNICVFHNAKFDISMLNYHFGFKFPRWEDTMLMHYLLNENEDHGLKYLVLKYTEMGDFEKELDDYKREYCKHNGVLLSEFTYDLIPFEILSKYAAGDTDATMRLYNKFFPYIAKNSNFTKVYNSLLKDGTEFLIEIQDKGIPFSREQLLTAQKEFSESIFALKTELYSYPEVTKAISILKDTFNPNSTKHLRTLFFDVMKLPVVKLTPQKVPSTDKEVLDELSKLGPIPALVKKIRQTQKIKSTYIDKVLAGLDSDGRLRTGFHLHTVTSGRLSSSGKLNAQQLPRDDKTIKKCITAIINGKLDPDYYVFSQDLQTAEMYYAAVESGDEKLMDIFRKGGDFHSNIAKQVFNLPCSAEEVKNLYPIERQAAKAVSFGILYGAGAAKVADTAKISIHEANEAIDKYFNTFKKLKKWLTSTTEEIKRTGYTYSAFGRKRRVKNVFSPSSEESGHAARSAVNFRIQSVASDVNLLASIEFSRWLKETNKQAEVFALVHDSIIGLVHKDEVEEVKAKLKEITQKDRGVSIPGCPIGVDFLYGANYAEAA